MKIDKYFRKKCIVAATKLIIEAGLTKEYNMLNLIQRLIYKRHLYLVLVLRLLEARDSMQFVYMAIDRLSSKSHAPVAKDIMKHFNLQIEYFPRL